MRSRILSALVCALFVFTANAWAQTSTGQIIGTVLDPSGAVVAGAKVVIKNEATGITYETTTTSAGIYTVTALPPGSYAVTVTQPGFQTFTSVKNDLTVGANLEINATLKVGKTSEVVQVEASYEKLETTNAMLSDVVTRTEIVELPLNGRNPLNLIVLEPGLVQRTNNAAGSGTHVFGSRDRAHNVTVDGIDANESSVPNPQNNILRLTPDNVQEYRVVTHGATAEFGRNSGANVAIATRSGTNELHGDVYYFHRNTVLNANEWFNNANGIERPVLLLHQFGFTLGGPIIKNRTFFFFSYQGNKIKENIPVAASFGIPRVYTATARNGIFRFVRGCVNPVTGNPSSTCNGPGDTSANTPALVDANGNLKPGVPVCNGLTITNNCVNSYGIFGGTNPPPGVGPDPAVSGLINSLPAPNDFSIGDGLNVAGFTWNPPSAFSGPFVMFRFDHRFDENNNLLVRYIHGNYFTTKGDLLNSRPSVYPGFPPLGEVFRFGRNLAISYRRVLSPAVVNEFTTGFNYFKFRFTFGESNPGLGDPTKDPPWAQSCIQSSFVNIDAPFCNSPHTQRAVSTIQFIDNLSYIRGAHTVRTGFNIRFYRHNDSRGLAGGKNTNPEILFDGSGRDPRGLGWRNLPSGSAIDSGDLGTLNQAIVELAGIPAELDQAFAADLRSDTFGGLQVTGTRVKQFNLYLQDEWKIRRNLTATYGLRWEWNLPATDCCGRVVVPDKRIDGSQGAVTYRKSSSWWGRDNANAFAPRVSLAWDPWSNGKTIARAGYGIYFDTISTFQITAVSGQVLGSVLNCRLRLTTSSRGVFSSALTPGCTAPSFTSSQTISNGFPMQLSLPTGKPSSTFSPTPSSLGAAPGAAGFDNNLKVPTVHEWDLTIQRELPFGFTAQVGYIGKRGTRLYRAYDLNQLFTNQAGLLDSFLIARNNVGNGCRADSTGCPPGTGVAPTFLLSLVTPTFLNSSTVRTQLQRNGLGDLVRRIDTLAFSTFTSRGFPANFFRPNPQFGRIFYFDSGGDSYYQGLIVELRRRFEKGLTMGLAYTFGKSIDDMSVDPVGASSGGALTATGSRTPTDVRNFRLDRSRSDFDNKHVIIAHYLYELPFGHGRKWGTSWSGTLNQILGGWTLTGIYTYESGEPYTLNSGLRTAVGGLKVSRADIVGPVPSSDLKFVPGITGPVLYNVSRTLIPDPRDPRFKTCKQVIGTQSFFCIPAAGQYGTGRNAVDGPGFWNFDFGVLKNFTVTERIKMEFRTEFFNLFNHANFENPRNATEGSPTLTSGVFGQTCCVTSSLASSATIIAVGEPSRVIQFALKVNF